MRARLRLMKPTAKLTIGIDLGDRRHTVCVLNEAGVIVAEEQLTNTRACLEAFSARFPGATMILETGTHCSTHRPRGGHLLVSPSASLRATPAA